MPEIKYKVDLTEEEMQKLKEITHNGTKNPAKTIMHAHILLKSNESDPEVKRNVREIAEIFDISPNTVNEVRKIYALKGLNSALNRKSRLSPPIASKITGDFEAQMIAIMKRSRLKQHIAFFRKSNFIILHCTVLG